MRLLLPLVLASVVLSGCGRLRFEDLPLVQDNSRDEAGVRLDAGTGSNGDAANPSAVEASVVPDAESETDAGEAGSAEAAADEAATDTGASDALASADARVCPSGTTGAACDECLRYADIAAPASSADGLTWTSAFPDLIQAIGAALQATQVAGGPTTCTVWVREGRYTSWRTNPIDTLPLTPEVPVYGGFAGSETQLSQRDLARHTSILDGANADGSGRTYHVLSASRGGLLDGFTITSSAPGPDGYGGGMRVFDGSMLLRNVRFLGNDLLTQLNEPGGALMVSAGSTRIEHAVFENNRARRGGAIAVLNASLTLRDVTFGDNSASDRGGAIYSEDSALDFDDVRFERNAARQGGAVAHYYVASDVLLRWQRVTVRRSTATELAAGLLIVGPATLAFENMLVALNSSGSIASGALLERVRGSLTAITSAHNTTSAVGGNALLLNCTPDCALRNSILWNPGSEQELSAGAGISIRDSLVRSAIIGSVSANHVLSADPSFVSAEDFHLTPASPAIDAANGCAGPERDLDGNGRFDRNGVSNTGVGPVYSDMGAYEVTTSGTPYAPFSGLCP